MLPKIHIYTAAVIVYNLYSLPHWALLPSRRSVVRLNDLALHVARFIARNKSGYDVRSGDEVAAGERELSCFPLRKAVKYMCMYVKNKVFNQTRRVVRIEPEQSENTTSTWFNTFIIHYQNYYITKFITAQSACKLSDCNSTYHSMNSFWLALSSSPSRLIQERIVNYGTAGREECIRAQNVETPYPHQFDFIRNFIKTII